VNINEEIEQLKTLAKKYGIKVSIDYWDTRNLKVKGKKQDILRWSIKFYHPEVENVRQIKAKVEAFKKIGRLAKKLGWTPDRMLRFDTIYKRGQVGVNGKLKPGHFSLTVSKEITIPSVNQRRR